jgi:hypothetical protein
VVSSQLGALSVKRQEWEAAGKYFARGLPLLEAYSQVNPQHAPIQEGLALAYSGRAEIAAARLKAEPKNGALGLEVAT